MVRPLTDEERAFLDGCTIFKPYSSIDEYIEDIRRCLTLSSWHYSVEEAERRTQTEMQYIRKAYEEHEPADYAATEVGYCCG